MSLQESPINADPESGYETLKVTCIGRGRVPSTSSGQVGPSIRYSTADTSYHRLNMESLVRSPKFFGLEGAIVSQDRRHFNVTPCLLLNTEEETNLRNQRN